MDEPLTADTRYITPAIRVIDTGKEWIIQTTPTKRTRRGTKPTGEWVNRAHVTGWSILNTELKRLVGDNAPKTGLRGHVEKDTLDWLNALPARHPYMSQAKAAAEIVSPVLDMLEAQGIGRHDAYDLRDDIPLVVKHGPLKYRDRWNARFDV